MCALLHCDGFDGYNADLNDIYEHVLSESFVTTGGRFGTRCYQIALSSTGIGKDIPDSTTIITGVAMQHRPTEITDYGNIIFTIRRTPFSSGANIVASLLLNSDLSISMIRGSVTSGTVLGTSTFRLTPLFQFFYIEWKVEIGSSGSYEVRVNERTWLSANGVNTDGAGGGRANRVYLAGGDVAVVTSIVRTYYDDWYICDTTGTTNNDFLGDVHVSTHLANAAGSNTQFTPVAAAGGSPPNFEMIDDTPTPDDENTYNSGTASGQKDTYNFANTSIPFSDIKAVQVRHNERGGDADGTPIIRAVVRDGGVDYSGTNTISTINEYKYRTDIFESNPATPGTAWTRTQVNDDEFGVEVV